MTIAKILVPLTGSKTDSVSLATAFAIAKGQKAYVDALFAYPDSRETLPTTDMPISPEIAQELIDVAEAARKSAAKSARDAFSVTASLWDAKIVSVPEKSNGITTTYREMTGHAPGIIRNEALLSDLVVFPPMGEDEPAGMHEAFLDVLTKSGRPVLLSAQRAPKKLGDAVLIGWDGHEAAAQALLSAMPILETARAVQFACVRPDNGTEHPLRDAQEYLSLHGIDACETLLPQPNHSIAQELLETAQASNYDLLVVGGYGHSRTLEGIFGGTTDYLVSHSDIPLWMAR